MKNLTLKTIYVFGSGLALIGLYIGVLQINGNFHEIVRGELYRSGQLPTRNIAIYAERYHIKSILNLRGAQKAGTKWYEDELQASKAAGVYHQDFRISAKTEMTREQALELIEVMKNMPKPMLIHCRSGSDRTGLAAAFYLAGVKKDTEFNSELQLSLLYGHIALWFTEAYAMNETFENLEPYLGYFDS